MSLTEDQQDPPRPRGRPPGFRVSDEAKAHYRAGALAQWDRRKARTREMALYEAAIRAIQDARQAGMEEEDIQEILAQALGLGSA